MVKICEGHKYEVERGCTYQIVESGITTNEKLGIELGETGIYLKDSECVICTKLRKLHELVALIGREMINLDLVEYIHEEERQAIFHVLHQMINFKIMENW